ncbi:MAG TPA: hypothetical protein ENH06_00615 [bacterium]|nr:hypothetical protein [bacterium]
MISKIRKNEIRNAYNGARTSLKHLKRSMGITPFDIYELSKKTGYSIEECKKTLSFLGSMGMIKAIFRGKRSKYIFLESSKNRKEEIENTIKRLENLKKDAINSLNDYKFIFELIEEGDEKKSKGQK